MLTDELNKQIKELQNELHNLVIIRNLIITDYPDLKEQHDRWNKKYYVSSLVNTKVNKVNFGHSCGCCADSPLLAYFYVSHYGVKIYADPHSICIGEANAYGTGEKINENWKAVLQRYNINPEIYHLVEKFIQDNLPVNYEDDEEED